MPSKTPLLRNVDQCFPARSLKWGVSRTSRSGSHERVLFFSYSPGRLGIRSRSGSFNGPRTESKCRKGGY